MSEDMRNAELQFNAGERRTLLRIAREAIRRSFHEDNPRFDPAGFELSPHLQTLARCFVTLKIDGALRGCIGSVVADQELCRDVFQNAIKAATRDHRFEQLRPDELEQLQIEISCLSAFEPVYALDEIEISRHGVYIEFRAHRGLFLPQVAVEQHWDTEAFLNHLCNKAGLKTKDWQSFEGLFRFTATVFNDAESDCPSRTKP